MYDPFILFNLIQRATVAANDFNSLDEMSHWYAQGSYQ